MKIQPQKRRTPAARRVGCSCGILIAAWILVSEAAAQAGTTNGPAAKLLTPLETFEGGQATYDNWVEIYTGGLMTQGSTAQAQSLYQLHSGPFGGIRDLHWQQAVAKKTTLTLDGHALFDQNDYQVTLGLQREELGYLRFKAGNFRTWYNGAGG